MLGQRRRRWANIKPAFCLRLVFIEFTGPDNADSRQSHTQISRDLYKEQR